MTIDVYWSRSNPICGETITMSPLRFYPPEPLMKHIDYKEFFGPQVSKCPAIIDDLKNIFVIKSPVDLNIIITDNNVEIEGQSLEFAQAFLGGPQGKAGIHQLGMGYNFFAEKSLKVTQLPAYYDSNGFTENTHQITASFDAGRWFRTSGKPTFVFKPGNRTISLKEGEALMYFKFNTDEKVKLIEFEETPEMQKLANICATLKFHSQGISPLAECYEYFDRYNMRRRVLKAIKAQKLK